MRRLGLACSGALVLGALALVAAPAHGYVRTRTAHGTPVHWPGGCVFVQPDSNLPADVPPQTFDVIQHALQDWQGVTLNASCSYLQLKYDAPAPLEAHLDGKNIVKYRTDKWCHPNDTQNKNVCYAAAAVAITSVFYLDQPGDAMDGYIVDADIELNDINFTFVVEPVTVTPKPNTSIADLENTLTHELGHLQGLDHTCKDSSTPANDVDENGQPPPDCPALGNVAVTEATMYNSAVQGETKKRSPENDDIAGICAAYPVAHPQSSCAHTNLSSGGCGILPHPVGSPWWALLLLGALLARRAIAVAPRRG